MGPFAGDVHDNGNVVDTDECTNACTEARCGDGVQAAGEVCDDGNAVDDDACSNACALPVVCGDGVVQAGEECDARGESAGCDADCSLAVCGDGVVNAAALEECDAMGESAECDADCSARACGDGTVNAAAGELCDDANVQGGDGCSQGCTPTEVVQLVAGGRHVCVVFADGAMHCWGDNSFGQLGYGSSANLGDVPGELPTGDVPVGAAVTAVGLGNLHTCARVEGDALRCWGSGGQGQLGYMGAKSLGAQLGDLPTPEVEVFDGVLQVDGGDGHTCVRTTAGGVRCWGLGAQGQLGYGSNKSLNEPNGIDLAGLIEVQQIALGSSHSCALVLGEEVRCWGNNNFGQLGLGHINAIGDGPGEMPPVASMVGSPGDAVASIAAGAGHSCAVLFSGKVRCWGSNGAGQLGVVGGAVGDAPGEMPPKDVDLGMGATQVVAGEQHSCALLMNRAVKCWGRAPEVGYPGLGNIDTAADFPPPDVDLGGEAVMLASHGGRSTCALLTDNTVRCWGSNLSGQLGYGSKFPVGDDETPAMAGPVPF